MERASHDNANSFPYLNVQQAGNPSTVRQHTHVIDALTEARLPPVGPRELVEGERESLARGNTWRRSAWWFSCLGRLGGGGT